MLIQFLSNEKRKYVLNYLPLILSSSQHLLSLYLTDFWMSGVSLMSLGESTLIIRTVLCLGELILSC